MDGFTEIRKSDIPPVRRRDMRRPRNPNTKYNAMLREVVLRLEQTPNTRALRQEHKDSRRAVDVRMALRRAIQQAGLPPDAICLVQRQNALYISRGKDFAKVEVGPDGFCRVVEPLVIDE